MNQGKKTDTEGIGKLVTAFYALVTTAAFCLNSELAYDSLSFYSDIRGAFQLFPIWDTAFFCLLFRFYMQTKEHRVLELLRHTVPVSILLAAFYTIGFAYANGSTDFLIGSRIQRLKSVIQFMGCAIFLNHFLTWLFVNIKRKESMQRVETKKGNWFFRMMDQHPFLTCFFVLLIAYFPLIIINAPALFLHDTQDQMGLALRLYKDPETYKYIVFPERYSMTNAHPLIHTLLIRLCLFFGKGVFSSWNMAALMYTTIQMILFTAAISYSVTAMTKARVHIKLRIAYLFYFILHPRICNYIPLITKDVLYSATLLVLLSVLSCCMEQYSKNRLLALGIFTISTILFRNEGGLVCLAIYFSGSLLRNRRKLYLGGAFFTILIYLIWSIGVLNALHVAKGKSSEILSVPLLQTSYYLNAYSEDITEDEYNAINAVADYKALAKSYRKGSADLVKSTFRADANAVDILCYLKVYIEMFAKHPMTCIDAYLRMKFGFFYPSKALSKNTYSVSRSVRQIAYANDQLGSVGADFSTYPVLVNAARKIELIRETIFRLPVFCLVLSPAAYIWIAIILFAYNRFRGNQAGMVFVIPILMIALFNLLGPTNASYFRYLFPIAVCLPFVCIKTISNNVI